MSRFKVPMFVPMFVAVLVGCVDGAEVAGEAREATVGQAVEGPTCPPGEDVIHWITPLGKCGDCTWGPDNRVGQFHQEVLQCEGGGEKVPFGEPWCGPCYVPPHEPRVP